MGAARRLGRRQNKRLRPPGNTVPAPPLELPEPEVPLDDEPVPVVVLEPPELPVVPDEVEVGWVLPPKSEVPLDDEPVLVVVLDPPELPVVPDEVEVGWVLPPELPVAWPVGVVAGSFAAAGWLLLTGAGVLSDPLPARGGLLEAGGGA